MESQPQNPEFRINPENSITHASVQNFRIFTLSNFSDTHINYFLHPACSSTNKPCNYSI